MQLKYDGKWWLDLIILILAVAIIYGGFNILTFTKSEGFKCINQPFVYGADRMGNVSCNCFQYGKQVPLPFMFNDTSFVSIPINYNPMQTGIEKYLQNQSMKGG